MKAYFDNAATTAVDEVVFEKMRKYFTEEFGNTQSVHSVGRRSTAALDAARDKVAKLINSSYKEVYFTSGGTEADNAAIKGIALASGKKKIIISSIEHSAILSSAKDLEEAGFTVEYLRPNEKGIITAEELASKISSDVALVSVMLANNETGVINPVKDLAEIARSYGVPFHTDAVQAAPSMRIDVRDLGVDAVTLSAHKIHGPKGAGCLYVKEGIPKKSLISGGYQERGFRGGTVNLPLVVGFAEALSLNYEKLEERRKKTEDVRNYFEKRLAELEGVKVNFQESPRVVGVSSVNFSANAHALLTVLDLNGVSASVGSACTAGSVLPSHVLRECGLDERDALSTVRFSFSWDNTFEEVDYTIEILKDRLDEVRRTRLFASNQKTFLA